ncbi:hypothetical protein FQN57_007251 [Myotisia sp. PD_48]|nr:hypothetical protein FQN57_007251 [Myotisia sp. PD_48]
MASLKPANTLNPSVDLNRVIHHLNLRYNLNLPVWEQFVRNDRDLSPEEQCVKIMNFLSFQGGLQLPIEQFEDWAASQFPKDTTPDWKFKPNQEPGTLPIRSKLLQFTKEERSRMVEDLYQRLRTEYWFVQNSEAGGSTASPTASFTSQMEDIAAQAPGSSLKRKPTNKNEVFSTAPSSPVKLDPCIQFSSDDEFDDDDDDEELAHYFGGLEDFAFSFDTDILTDVDEPEFYPSLSPANSGRRQMSLRKYGRISKDYQNSPSLEKSFQSSRTGLDTSYPSFSNSLLENSMVETSTPDTTFESPLDSMEPGISIKTPGNSFETMPVQRELFTNHSVSSQISKIVSTLEFQGPFSNRPTLPGTVDFRYRYEVERLARAHDIPIDHVVPEFELPDFDSYSAFWQHMYSGDHVKKAMEKVKPQAWKESVGNFLDRDAYSMVTLSGKLDWCNHAGFMKLTLNPLKLEKSHRFARRFGADRFLEITAPIISDRSKNVGFHPDVFRKAFGQWLATAEHHLFGRVWRAFFLEDHKAKTKPSAKKDMRSKVFFFAVDGEDFARGPPSLSPEGEQSHNHTTMSLEQFMNWHIPIQYNRREKDKDCKLFNRMRLGLSRTIPSVALQQHEIIYIDDDRVARMSDGCSMMSHSLGRSIANVLGLSNHPTCFQGRIAGAKGLWIVAQNDDDPGNRSQRGHWIKINSAQLKIQPPPCDERLRLDDHHLTFDVNDWSKALRPVNVNTQFLMVLQHGGVKKDYLASLVEKEADTYYAMMLDVLQSDDPVKCRRWVQQLGSSTDDIRKIDSNGLPANITDQIIMLLDSGFLPSQLRFLRQQLDYLFEDHLRLLQDLKIRIPESTYAYCIADPFGVLNEGEVHLAFSGIWEDRYWELVDIDVLVARAPAHLPSDIQKRRAVFHEKLRHFKDVIVFPTKGEVPLASLLSGGDYDGDEVWVCWDPALVDSFQNTPFYPEDIPQGEEFGLVSYDESMASNRSFNEFLTRVFIFNLYPNTLGKCTNDHERFCYHTGSIGSTAEIRFSYLLSRLADTRKSGHYYPADNWKKFRKELGPMYSVPPAYKDEEQGGPWKPDNIVDYLKFSVVKSATEKLRIQLNRDFPISKADKKDQQLISIWENLWDRANFEKDDKKNDGALLNAVQEVERKVRDSYNAWRNTHHKTFDAKILDAHETLMSIKCPPFEHDLCTTWRNSQIEWERILAVCAYKNYWYDKYPWLAGGLRLCEIKCEMYGSYRPVISAIHQAMKVNKRIPKLHEEDALQAGEVISGTTTVPADLDLDESEDDHSAVFYAYEDDDD